MTQLETSLIDTLNRIGFEAETLMDGTPFPEHSTEAERPIVSTEELNILAYEEKVLDDVAQCGAVSRHFPELAQAIMEAKRGLENLLIEGGIELGSVL